MREQSVDDECLSTLMCLVESTVNGRPLTIMSDDPNDFEPLTPNHLLLMRAGAFPLGVTVKQDQYSRKRWRQIQYLADIFWRRWTREYLPTLQLRSKWHRVNKIYKSEMLLSCWTITPLEAVGLWDALLPHILDLMALCAQLAFALSQLR